MLKMKVEELKMKDNKILNLVPLLESLTDIHTTKPTLNQMILGHWRFVLCTYVCCLGTQFAQFLASMKYLASYSVLLMFLFIEDSSLAD